MANPQIENGHLDLANEIVEALARIRLSGEESQCLWVLFRKTYCWHKKEDKISLSQFALMTGLSRPAVARAIKKLLSKKITEIIKNDNSYINIYRFNKDFDQWKPLSKKITVLSKKIMGVINIDNQVLSKKIHTKESITKETNTKEKEIVFDRLWLKYPNRVGKKDALRHYIASVKTDQDQIDIEKALVNYLNSKSVKENFIQNGSTWFNNWRDWVLNPISTPGTAPVDTTGMSEEKIAILKKGGFIK